MERFAHGGDTYGRSDAIDFSASLSPLGMPEGVRRALRENVDAFAAYPDPYCRALTQAIATAEGVPAEFVLCCAGATDAFARLRTVLAPQRACVCAPCYSGYEQELAHSGTTIVYHHLAEENCFAVTDSLVERVQQGGFDMLFLANPNNPTGAVIERELLLRILDAAAQQNIAVVLDECFIAFTDEPSAVDLLTRFPRLIVVKAFTKIFALAGLRLGYLLCSDRSLVQACAGAGQMWAVSAPAQIAGLSALENAGHVERVRAYVDREREDLARDMQALGLRVVPSRANFLLVEGPRDVSGPLLEHGIMVRCCANFIGLDERWFRVAVRTHEQNARLVQALTEVLA